MTKKAVLFIISIALLALVPAITFAEPAAVTDLSVISTGFKHVVLKWTVPYDVASDTTAAEYVIHASSYLPIINESDWTNHSSEAAYPYSMTFSTALVAVGEDQYAVISGLSNAVSWFFAIKSSTDTVNLSPLDTSSPEPFNTPFNTNPDDVSGHNHMNAVILYTSTPTLSWDPAPEAIMEGNDAEFGDYIVSYTVEISTDSLFTVKTVKDSINTTSWITNPLNDDTTYYWRVKAYDSGGLASLGYLSQNSRRFVSNGVNAAPTQPVLTSPIGYEIVLTNTPNFIWTTSSDSDPGDYVKYLLYFSSSSSFNVACTTAVSNLSVTNYIPGYNLIENATYYWKVYAYDQWNKSTMSSSTGTVRINGNPNENPLPFGLLGPPNGSEINESSATLSWQSTSDPDPGDTLTFTVDYSSSNPTFTVPSQYTSSGSLVATQWKTPALQEDTTYWWRVTAYDQDFRNYNTEVNTFTVNAVNIAPNPFDLTSSSGIIIIDLPVFKWQNTTDPDGDTVSFAVSYSSYSDFNTYISSAGLKTTTWTAQSAFKENTTYYWKVTAQDPFSHYTVSNQTWTVMINVTPEDPDAFSLSYPPDDSDVSYLSPSLDWTDDSYDHDPGDYVNYYIVDYSTASDFSVQFSSAGLKVSTFTFSSALSNNTTYYWKVIAVSALSGSATSQTWKFYASNQPPNAFSLISSSGNVGVATPVLTWQNAGDPESDALTYKVYYSSNSGFMTYQSSAGLVAAQYTTPAMEENRTYYWYVEAYDSWGNLMQSAQTWSFNVNALPEDPSAFSLVSPADNSMVNTRRPSLDWGDSSDVDPGVTITYTLWYSVDQSFASRTEITGIAQSSYDITSNLAAYTTYYWRVYAVGSDSGQRASSDWKFVVGTGILPAAPANFRITTVEAGKTARLTWDTVTKNEDGTNLTNLAGFRIFKAYDFDSVFTVSETTSIGSGTLEWTDDAVNNQNVYYLVRAYNAMNVDGLPSRIQFAGAEDKTMIYDTDKNMIITCPNTVMPSTVTIEITRLDGQETGNILRAYQVQARDSSGQIVDFTFAQPVEIKFKLSGVAAPVKRAPGSETLATGMFWDNGVEWVYLGGEKSGTDITAMNDSLGGYQLRTVVRSIEFKTLTIWPKIITPNGDNINDEMNMTFENPTSDRVEGTVYYLDGSQAAKMSSKTDYWLTWDGKDDSGSVQPAGIYIYQVKCGNKIYNGTVVIAK
ncbi:MAG: hypothetical protein ABII64_08025 [Elusimicrobiota bacterium]